MDLHFYETETARMEELASQEHFEEALAIAEHLLTQFPVSPYLLMKRGFLIQLYNGEELPQRTLEAARESLVSACALAPDYVQPRIELGHFLYAIDDEAGEGLEQFQIARDQAETDLQEALIGEAKCYVDRGRFQHASEVVARLLAIFPDNAEALRLEAEFADRMAGQETAGSDGPDR
jgi:tetratricopeptide (TPR) repeat protein